MGRSGELTAFVHELRSELEAWVAAGKRGLWLTIPAACHAYISAARSAGFDFHHATPEGIVLTRWLPKTPSPLPRFAFTLIGVGGVVLDERGHVLMVQEMVSPAPRMQGSWKYATAVWDTKPSDKRHPWTLRWLPFLAAGRVT